jgi:hypothetical protein
MITGLTNALTNHLPIDGSVEMCVVQFGSSASQELAPLVVDSQADKDTVINTITNISKGGGSTSMHSGINQAVTTMGLSSYFNNPDVWKVINLATDGYPDSTSLAEAAVTAAAGAGIDEIDAEAIGSGAATTWLASDMVYPDGPGGASGPIVPPATYPPRPPDPNFMGFVRVCTTFADYEDAVAQKLILILKGQLSLDPLQARNPVGDQHCVTALLLDGYGQPAPGVTIDFVVTGANSASGSAATDANGQAQFCYTGTNLGTDYIDASCPDPQDPQKTLNAETAQKEWYDGGTTQTTPVEVGGDIYPTNTTVMWLPIVALVVAILAATGIAIRKQTQR